MRVILLAWVTIFLFSCNSSSKKEPKQAMDDTARMPARLSDSGGNNPASNTIPAVAIEPVKITAAQLPESIKFKGKLNEAWQWTDKLGENILITSYVEPYDDKEKGEGGEEGQSAELHAAQYVKKEGGYVLQWKNDDGEKSCPFDITCKFIKSSTTITDLDKNGVAETTIQYLLACRSDVSPSEMKLFLHEGTANYYLKGLCWVKLSEEDKFTVTEKDANLETLPGYKKTDEEYLKTFGRYESEKGFAGAPPEFLAYAKKQWLKFAIETFE